MRLDRGGSRCIRRVLACFGATILIGCQTETVLLSPAMHARVIDGLTRRPLSGVRVILLSPDALTNATAYSNRNGFVDLPPLLARQDSLLPTDTPRAAVHAIFERPGYQTYTIDSANGYGFFKGTSDVRLYPE